MNKYGNEITFVDGIRFQSKKEANYYCQLKLAKQSGSLLYFLRQVPIHLSANRRYIVDFQEFWKKNNGEVEVRYVDVKGFKTPTYELKKDLVESFYPIKILEA